MAITGLTRRQALLTGAGLAAGALSRRAFAEDVAGKLTAWDWSLAPSVPGVEAQTEFYTKYFPGLYPNMQLSSTIFGYTDLLPKLTVAWRAGNTPDVCRGAIQWSPQFVGNGQCAEITEAELGIPFSDFLPGALISNRKNGAAEGPVYGIPSNNESMFLIYNKALFAKAGIEKPPETWDELAATAKIIHDKTGAYGYGMCAQQNHGNTPYRFMPMAWAHGGSIFDELSPHPTWREVGIGGDGVVQALELYNRMFNVDKSVQPSALSDNQNNVQTLFLDGKVAMCIDHPSFPQQIAQLKPDIQVGGALLPKGPVRRAVVLGGSNFHIRATAANKPAALALIKAYLTPYWNVRLGTGAGSQASRASARASEDGKKFALPFSNLVFEMMTYGVNVPLVTQSGQIWNITVPSMIQQVLSGRATAKEAAGAAAGEIKKMMAA